MTKLYLVPGAKGVAGANGPLRADGAQFDARRWRWGEAAALPETAQAVDTLTALRAALALPGPRVPIGVIGPREASAQEVATAFELGRELAALGLVVVTGGLTGVMEAASHGASDAGGLTVGLLPGEDWRAANAFVSLPLATGIGKARNAVIAQASRALVAVGGGYGTLTEIAYGLHFDKPVLTLGAAPAADGAEACANVRDALERLATRLLHGAVPQMS